MLPFRVGAIDFNRPGTELKISRERLVRVGRRCLRSASRSWMVLFLSVVMAGLLTVPKVSGETKGGKKRGRGAAKPNASPGEPSLTNVPLPIGHDAKGLVLPDFDGEGRLRGRFEAGTAHRIDQEHIGFQHLKITTYTPESQPDLQIGMRTSVLDLKTRILSSQDRTTIQRSDFNIAGDSVVFDTNARTGRLIGNVKMVITDKSHLTAKPDTSE
jgi:hypothetical protein